MRDLCITPGAGPSGERFGIAVSISGFEISVREPHRILFFHARDALPSYAKVPLSPGMRSWGKMLANAAWTEAVMHAVIFEVEPEPARRQDYLDIAARLRPELEQIDGFISVERFQSLTTPDKILSLSFWRDEASVARWRRQEEH